MGQPIGIASSTEILKTLGKLLSEHQQTTDRFFEKLATPDVTVADLIGDVDPITGEPQVESISFFNKLSRHFILGAEILLSKNFHVRVAYNFQRRREMVIETMPGLVGFSMGVGLKISKFIISYGRGNYHLAGGANHFSITTNLSEFGHKEK